MLKVMRTPQVSAALTQGKVHGALIAGGAGSRMGAITDVEVNMHARQKAMLPLGGHAICEYAIRPMLDIGLPKVHVFVGYLSETVMPELSRKYPNQVAFVEAKEPYVNTAGNALRIITEALDTEDGTLIVRSGDIASNIDPMGPLSAQLAGTGKGATIVVNPVPWSHVKDFGTVLTDRMPVKPPMPDGISLSDQRELIRKFHQDVDVYYTTHRGTAKTIAGFSEKVSEDEAPSNLNNSSDYYISIALMRALAPHMTETRPLKGGPSFSDFGGHIWPALTTKKDLDLSALDDKSRKKMADLIDRIRHTYSDGTDDGLYDRIVNGEFPFYAYLMPEYSMHGTRSFWMDLGRPSDYHEGNMAVLRGELKNDSVHEHIMRGSFGGARIIDSIVDGSAKMASGSLVMNSVIGRGVTIGPNAKIVNSVVFPTLKDGDLTEIGRDTIIANAILTGGNATGEFISDRGRIFTFYMDTNGQMRVDQNDSEN